MDAQLHTSEGMAHHVWLAPIVPVLETLAVIIDLIGIAIVLYGFAVALVAFFKREAARYRAGESAYACQSVRLTLGMYILLGIEFMIASDIIHTVISRALGDLLLVAALVAIRTAISFFLGKELEDAKRLE
ncbi:DUF1622 domain-containing protein [Maricaulaceae bacterium MS644]